MSSSINVHDSMSRMLDSQYETWSFTRSDNPNPVNMVYIREFSDDKTKAFISTFDFNNSECLEKSQAIASKGCIATLQKKSDGEIFFIVSETLKSNFQDGREYKVVYQKDDSEVEICSPRFTIFIDNEDYICMAGIFKEFLVSCAKRKMEKSKDAPVSTSNNQPVARLKKSSNCTIQ